MNRRTYHISPLQLTSGDWWSYEESFQDEAIDFFQNLHSSDGCSSTLNTFLCSFTSTPFFKYKNGKVSEDLKKCTRLQYLDLGVNAFSNEVPDLSSLNGLKFLNLNSSGFSGIFPWKSLGNLTELTFLSLGDNPFDESLFPVEVLKLEKLYWLYLTNCSLTGQIPEGIQNLTLLQNLELSDNRLSGPIPAGIGKLNQLWQLELYNNSLSGKLPVGFGNLTNLNNFDASMNMLEGDLSELRSLKNLASLQLLENQFSGEVPPEFGEFKHLEGLSLYRNKLTGQLPPKLF